MSRTPLPGSGLSDSGRENSSQNSLSSTDGESASALSCVSWDSSCRLLGKMYCTGQKHHRLSETEVLEEHTNKSGGDSSCRLLRKLYCTGQDHRLSRLKCLKSTQIYCKGQHHRPSSYYYYYLLKTYSPINSTRSPQDFSQVQISHKLNTMQNMHMT